MKLDFKGLKFNVWLIVFLVALGVVFVMGILQFSLIRPYFRDNKVQAVKLISQDIQKYVINDNSKASIDEAFKIVVDNNVCAIITNENGKIIYSADSLGASCVFNQVLTINDISFSCNKDAYYLNEFIKKDNGQLNLTITNTKTNQETILYGKMINANLSNYYLYINSPGGVVTAGMAIYDTMQYIKPDVSTICIGQAASMGSLLLTAGAKGKRFALPNARIMIHQPLGGARGQSTDLQIQAKELLRIRQMLNEILSQRTGKSMEQIEADTERDNFMSAAEAVEYGLVDKVIVREADSQEDDSK